MFYSIKVFYSEEDKGFIAIVPDLPGCSAFGETEDDAIREVKIARESWLELAEEMGQSIPQPSPHESRYCGKTFVDLPKSLHKELNLLAEEEGVSMNQLIINILSKEIGRRQQALSMVTMESGQKCYQF
ncbi:MAG: type II toxin-antitoxin system HicB family antitoxin [Nitrospirae bacterium]|nr:type II toxin-antitoxin system HicB family antitoxin [Nitrospirota bacterium]